MNNKKQVGFEDELLRSPGQSVNDDLLEYIQDKVDPDLFVISLSTALLVVVWVSQIIPFNSSPILLSIFLIFIIIVFSLRLYKAKIKMGYLRQGRDGERYVGQLLELMRKDGNLVFHDVVAENFNLDHVLIGPRGIYVIETKTWSKKEGKGNITYKDGVFLLDGYKLDKNPLDQAKANAKWYSDFLKESTGKKFHIQPVLVLPGWFIQPEDNKRAREDGVLLLNPKALPAFINNRSESVATEDAHLVAYHTSRFIKSK